MFCRAPFDCLDVCHLHASPCCRLWLDQAAHVGWTEAPEPWKIWNCEAFQRLRRSVLDGSYTFCRGCPKWIDKTIADRPDDSCRPVMERGPFVLNFGTESACNLRCWTCYLHPDLPATSIEDQGLRQRELWDFSAAFLRTSALATFQTAGDPLAGPITRQFLERLDLRGQDFPMIRLFTNAMLLVSAWPGLAKIHQNIRSMWVSIDAASRETYERVRCRASWDRLIAALEFARDRRQTGALEDLQLNFVVRAANWREMPAFLEFARRYQADRVDFGLFRRMAQHTDAEFAAEDISNPTHPDHADYCELIGRPEFSDPFVQGAFRPSFFAAVAADRCKL